MHPFTKFKVDQQLVVEAIDGKLSCLDTLLDMVKDDVFKLSLKFLWHIEDAEDASQEILVRIITHLRTFRGESNFRTWAYRIAVNYLLNAKRSRIERHHISFARIEHELQKSQINHNASFVEDIEQNQMTAHVRAACTHAMLQALQRDARMAFLLGSVFQMNSKAAAFVLGISDAAYRKRLSRARQRMHTFVHSNCGVRNPAANCRCEIRATYASKGRNLAGYLKLAEELYSEGKLKAIEELHHSDYTKVTRLALLFRNLSTEQMPTKVLLRVQKLFQHDNLNLLQSSFRPGQN